MTDSLATKIRTARKDADLTREKLAGELNVSLSTIVRLETGRTQRISAETLMKIAVVTKKPLSYFLGQVAA